MFCNASQKAAIQALFTFFFEAGWSPTASHLDAMGGEHSYTVEK
jgi:hypothetical protein